MNEFERIEELYKIIHNPNYRFNDNYCLCYLTPDSYEAIRKALSELRRLKEINGNTFHIINSIFKHHYQNYSKIKYLNSIQPRLIAQKFIGKRNIREFIFKRDGYNCLRCGKEYNLTIDHINPIHNSGENKLSNLQTLCQSCNSWKSTKYLDLR